MLKLFDRSWLVIVMLLTVAALPVRTQASTPTIVISEIAWAGSSISASDEWIELTNVGDEPVDLTGWTLTGAGSAEADLVLPEGSVAQPHSTYLIANYELAHENTTLAIAPSFVTATLSLPNGGFDLHLYDNGGSLVDVAGGSGAPFAGRSGGTADSDGRYASMQRVDGLGDGSLESSWADATSSKGFLEGVEDLGTPGIIEFADTTVVEEPLQESDPDEIVEEITEPQIEETAAELEVEEIEIESDPEPAIDSVIGEEPVEVPETTTETDPLTENPSDLVFDIRINEFVVDPSGDGVEWIELYNAGSTAVLEGWSIEDESSKATDLSGQTVETEGYLVIESPTGKLNNDGDTIVLKDASGVVVASVSYGKDAYPTPKDGEALARNGDTFEVTQLTTPGASNLIFVALEESDVILNEVKDPNVESGTEGSTNEETDQLGDPSSTDETRQDDNIIKTLRLFSLYPNTTGSDADEEYITIQNFGDESVDLTGWMLEDGSTDTFTLDGGTLAAGATMQLGRPETKMTLNNTGDTLELIAPDEDVVDKVTYGNAAKGATYDLVNGTWTWSGAAAVAESSATESVTTSTPATTSSSASTSASATFTSSTASARVAQSVTIAQAKDKTDGQNVMVKGIVTAAPGMFGSQTFYLEDETGGIQVYLYSTNFPALDLGDVVKITGELSTSRGERRIKLAGATGVVPASGSFESEASTLSLEEIDELLVGSLVTTQGQVQSKSSTKLVLERSGATLTVYLKSNPSIDPNQFERGDELTVTGVLTNYDGDLRLRPRNLDDIVTEERTQASTALTSSTSDAGSSGAGLILLFSTMAALALLALWRYFPRRRLTPASV